MNPLTAAAKKGSISRGERREREEREREEMRVVDEKMRDSFCPLINGDCRGISCVMFDPNYENECNAVNFVNYVSDELVGIGEILKKISQKI